MNWYAAKIIFQIENDNLDALQFDEQIRLINAINKDLAIEIAHQIGLMAQEDLPSAKGNLKWKFIAVTEVEDIGNLEQGKEVYYQIKEPEIVSTYLLRIKEKALSLKHNKTLKHT